MQSAVRSPDQQKVSMAVEILRTSGSLRFAARGYSMLPSLWPGDVLTVQAMPGESLEPGDIVLYEREARLYAHRMLRRTTSANGESMVVRGDSMPRADRPVLAQEVLGKVKLVERDGHVLPGIPRCTPLMRLAGLVLCWDRLRSVVLRLRTTLCPGSRAISSESFSL